jgi:hypothetical protein
VSRGKSAWALVALLVVVSTIVRTWAGELVDGPWITPDETVYALLGQSLYRHGTLEILGGPTPFYSLVVPLIVGPFLSLGDLELGYALVKPVLALVMSLAAVPVFVWARTIAGVRWALAAAALTLVLPGLAYSGLVMSEVVFYPAFTLAAWAAAVAIAAPTRRHVALVALAVTLALLTRLQALVLLPVVVVAVVVDALFARSLRRVRATAPVVAATFLPVVVWLLFQQLRGEPTLGAYESVAAAPLSTGDAARFVIYHLAAIVLTTGVIPICALVALALDAARRGELDPLRRSTVAVAIALVGGVVAQVGVFASQHVGQLAERDLLCVIPTVLVCFALWLGRGGVGGWRSNAVVAAAVVAALSALPFEKLVNYHALFDAITLAPLWHFAERTSANTLTLVVLLLAGVAGALFVFLPRRYLAALPALLFVVGVLGSVSSSREMIDQAHRTRQVLVGNEPRWIDNAAHGRTATYAYDGNRDWPAVWLALFWNRSLHHVAVLGPNPVPGPVPQRPLGLEGDGRIDVRDPDVVLASSFSLAGTPVAEIGQLVPGQGGLRRWQLEQPPRVLTRAIGLKTNGDIYKNERATIMAYDCRRGTWQLTVIPKEEGYVQVFQDWKLLKQVHFTAAQASANYYLNLDLPARAHSGLTCRLDVKPTGLIGTTRFGYAAG